jgi:ribulose 1,5-bisphosphate synthetase/thiazole synthase
MIMSANQSDIIIIGGGQSGPVPAVYPAKLAGFEVKNIPIKNDGVVLSM